MISGTFGDTLEVSWLYPAHGPFTPLSMGDRCIHAAAVSQMTSNHQRNNVIENGGIGFFALLSATNAGH